MGRSLKFCHISTFYPPFSFGGDAIFLRRLANALAQRGHEVDVIHCADSFHALHPEAPTKEFPNDPRVTVHALRSRWGLLSPLIAQQTGQTWPKTQEIRKLLMSKNFDVIHYHNISLLGPAVLRLEPDYRGALKVYTMHEHWLVCPMHILWKNNDRLCEKPQCFSCTLKFRRPPQWWRYTKLLNNCANSVDMFFSPSRFTRDMHHERGFVRQIEHLPHFVPSSDDSPHDFDLPPHSRPYFLFVGRLEKIKGLQTVIPLFRDYRHADLLVAGTGEFEAELRRQADAFGNVVFLGSRQQRELRRYYRHAIAVVVPSLCYEVFGNIIVEAYRERTPVIVHGLGGLRELVEESQGGFAYRTSEELLDAIERLRTDHGLRCTMGEHGYRTYLERWSEDVHLDAYLQLLARAADRKFGCVPWEQFDRPGSEPSAALADEPGLNQKVSRHRGLV
jgi:glycosyltransferase involved in cell wall biosynthesis